MGAVRGAEPEQETTESTVPRQRRGGDPSPRLERAVPDEPDEKREVTRERPDPRRR